VVLGWRLIGPSDFEAWHMASGMLRPFTTDRPRCTRYAAEFFDEHGGPGKAERERELADHVAQGADDKWEG
jgi:hypothetical protein